MKSITRLLFVALLIITAGCSSQIKLGGSWHLPEPSGPEDALIFGHIIIGENESPLTPEYVRILRKDKIYFGMGLEGIGEKTYVFTDGRFVTPVKPGKFNFNAFFANRTLYRVETENPTWFTIRPGQIYYLGSFQAKLLSAERIWAPGEFSVNRIQKPGERELHQWLSTISKGTEWEKKVDRKGH